MFTKGLTRAGSGRADPGLEAARGHGNAVADAKFGGLSIDDANFRIVEDLRRRIRHQEIRRRAWHRHAITLAENRGIVDQLAYRGRAVRCGRCGGRGTCSRRRAGIRERRRDARWRRDSDVAHAVAPRFHDRHLNHDFRLRLVDVVDNFSCEQHPVRRVANHDGVLRIDLLHAPQIQQLPDAGNNFREFLRQNGVAQIKCFYDFFLIILALLRLVRHHKNNIGGHRTPECLALQRGDVQRLLERYVGQLDGNSPRSEVRVEDDGQPGQLPDSFKNRLRVVRGLHVDRGARKGLDFGRSGHKLWFFRGCDGARFAWSLV